MTTPDWRCPRCGCTTDRETAQATWHTAIVFEHPGGFLYDLGDVCPNCVTEVDRRTDLKQLELDARARWHEWHVADE
jgi:hypothetical protein